jgi:cell shape-determining protein MreD
MNAVLVALLAWLALGFEAGLKHTLAIPWGKLQAAPGFVLPLAVIIALCAPGIQALWACMVLGLMMDLTSPQPLVAGQIVVLGPHALGFLVAGQFVLAVRGLVLRRNPFTVVVLSVIAGCIMQIVVTALLTVHAALDSTQWGAGAELGSRLLGAVVTGGTALLVALLVLPMAPLLGYSTGPGRGSFMRR